MSFNIIRASSRRRGSSLSFVVMAEEFSLFNFLSNSTDSTLSCSTARMDQFSIWFITSDGWARHAPPITFVRFSLLSSTVTIRASVIAISSARISCSIDMMSWNSSILASLNSIVRRWWRKRQRKSRRIRRSRRHVSESARVSACCEKRTKSRCFRRRTAARMHTRVPRFSRAFHTIRWCPTCGRAVACCSLWSTVDCHSMTVSQQSSSKWAYGKFNILCWQLLFSFFIYFSIQTASAKSRRVSIANSHVRRVQELHS